MLKETLTQQCLRVLTHNATLLPLNARSQQQDGGGGGVPKNKWPIDPYEISNRLRKCPCC